jgi:hypothetical protein
VRSTHEATIREEDSRERSDTRKSVGQVPDSLEYRLLVVSSTGHDILFDPSVEFTEVSSPFVFFNSVVVRDSVKVLEGRRS